MLQGGWALSVWSSGRRDRCLTSAPMSKWTPSPATWTWVSQHYKLLHGEIITEGGCLDRKQKLWPSLIIRMCRKLGSFHWILINGGIDWVELMSVLSCILWHRIWCWWRRWTSVSIRHTGWLQRGNRKLLLHLHYYYYYQLSLFSIYILSYYVLPPPSSLPYLLSHWANGSDKMFTLKE